MKKHGLVKTQKELAEKIGIGETPVSHLMQGTSLPSTETLLKMNEVFGGIFNLDYFGGDSDVMLVEDLKEEKGQPGFGGKSYLDEIVTMLREKVSDKEDKIASLERELATKDELVESMKQQVSDLRTMLGLKKVPAEHLVAGSVNGLEGRPPRS